jgi:DNA-binding MarR family transcriptional regulator
VSKKISAAEPALLDTACVALNLRKSSNIVSRYYARGMKSAPVRGPLFSLLAIIRKRGSTNITALARDAGLDRTTLTRNLKQLEQRGFIEISPALANRKEIHLLPAGSAALDAALLSWRKTQDSVVQELGEERWKRMRRDLAAVMTLFDQV